MRGRMMPKTHLLLVHGINSNAKWQKAIGRVFEPHFHVVKIRYWQYRWFGATKLALEPLAFVIFGIGILWLTSRYLPVWLAITLAVLCGIVLAFLAAPMRRGWALRSWVKQASPYTEYSRPHIIAHSFGSYLTGSALKNFPAVFARRIVFVGCVLDEKFAWEDLLKKKPKAFEAIRNDWTAKDTVVQLGRLLKWRIPDFGSAGNSGFSSGKLVHNVPSASTTCSACGPGMDAQIHNYDCTGLGHSDTFLGAHAARFWLPFFWRFDPVEYSDLLDCCQAASEAFANGQDAELKVAEDELLNSDWEWAHGTLVSCIRDLVTADPKVANRGTEELAGRASRLFWQILDRGRAAAESGDEQEKKWIVYLHPSRALAEAVHEVIVGP
jgi:hypothetical protein